MKDYLGDFVIGCVTQSVYITKQEIYQKYYVKGVGDKTKTIVQKNIYLVTPNFKNPYPLAIEYIKC